MQIDIAFSGYRCFGRNRPASLSLRDDIIGLVGLNNSGKSTLLKGLYEFRDIFEQISQGSGMLTAARDGQGVFTRRPETGDIAELFWHFGKSDLVIEIALPEIQKTSPKQVSKLLTQLLHNSDRYSVSFFDGKGTLAEWSRFDSLADEILDGRTHLLDACKTLAQCFYFPAVRHISDFSPEARDSRPAKFYDILSGKPFIEEWSKRKQGSGKTKSQLIGEITEEIRKIFGFQRLEIFADQNRRELMTVADGKSLRLGELGTGFAQFILMLGNIAFFEPSYVLIDEPENNLHPSLQLQFLQSIAARVRHGVIFATHSLGLARQVSNRVFALSRSGGDSVITPLAETSDLTGLIADLSFGRADALSPRALLLVEGATDVLTYDSLLSTLNMSQDFAILPLGGGGLICGGRDAELQHVLAINPVVAAIIDSEKKSEISPLDEPRAQFKAVCERLGIKCHVLERRAIEQYFPERAIRAAFPNAPFRALTPFESFKEVNPRWEKRDNWKIAREIRADEIEHTDLGKFLVSLRQQMTVPDEGKSNVPQAPVRARNRGRRSVKAAQKS